MTSSYIYTTVVRGSCEGVRHAVSIGNSTLYKGRRSSSVPIVGQIRTSVGVLFYMGEDCSLFSVVQVELYSEEGQKVRGAG